MKNVLSAFRSDVSRILVVDVLPGGLLIYPYYRWVVSSYPALAAFVGASAFARVVALIALAAVVGILLENVASRVEYELDRKAGRSEKEWFDYLCLAFRVEPLGQEYARELVMRMKFELATAVALVVALPGTWLALLPRSSVMACVFVSIAMLVISSWLFNEAKSSGEVLNKIRKRLLEKAKVPPEHPNSSS